jgi:KDO2-lipid IV(A) lauroyltransferase
VHLPLHPDAEKIRSVLQARQILERQGVVHIIADGYQGSSIMSLPFLGRWRPFRTGFAELAVQTGARVVPVFASLDKHGRVTVEFLPPLESRPKALKPQEHIMSLLTQYARLLEQRWLADPGNICRWQLQRFLKLPLIAENTD